MFLLLTHCTSVSWLKFPLCRNFSAICDVTALSPPWWLRMGSLAAFLEIFEASVKLSLLMKSIPFDSSLSEWPPYN